MITATAHRYRDHIVTGPAEQLANVVRLHRGAGTFVAHTAPRRLPDGRYQVKLRLVDQHRPPATPRPASPTRPPVQPRRGRRVAIAGTAAVIGLSGVGYLIVSVVRLIAANLPLILGVVAVLVVLALLVGGSKACVGVHCGGCSRH